MKNKINIQATALKVAGIGAGAYASVKINKIGFIEKQKPALRGVIKIAAGALLPIFLAKGKKADMIGNVGDGMIAGGVLDLATAFDKSLPALSGTNDVMGATDALRNVVFDEDYMRPGVSGAGDVMGSTDDVTIEM